MAESKDSRELTEHQEALSEVLADQWWIVALRGVVAILFGLVCFFFTPAAILAAVLFFSAYMLVDGVLAIWSGVKAARNGKRWGLLILEGIVDIAAGVIAFLWPAMAAVVFVLIIGIWAVISGGLLVYAAFSLKLDHGRWWLVLAGVASVIFGILLFVAPVIGAVVLTWWIGAYAVAFGILMLILGFKLKGKKDENVSKVPPAADASTKA
ncbi:MAG: HdeD family acid-resistance protein [Methyloceanibacter sp.]|nr:HdeD family acid-resistance protein [Methyloceanibacter sp.]